jgi:hypothetical protein
MMADTKEEAFIRHLAVNGGLIPPSDFRGPSLVEMLKDRPGWPPHGARKVMTRAELERMFPPDDLTASSPQET